MTRRSLGETTPDPEDALIAFTEERAAQLVDVTPETLRRWAQQGLVGATVSRRLSERNTVRLYGFQDLQALLVVKTLQETGPSHLAVRKVVEYLRREYARPLNELTFAVAGREIFFQHPDGTWEGNNRPHQTVARVTLPLAEIRATIRDAAREERPAEKLGKVERRRKLHGSKPVFAGTRIPVSAVEEFLDAGYDTLAILEEYPRLRAEDVDAVRRKRVG